MSALLRAVAAALLFGLALSASADLSEFVRALPEDTDWKSSAMLPNGIQAQLLVGDPKAGGLYAMRVRIPAGTRIPPHWHPDLKRTVTVISGTLRIGFGRTFDETKLVSMTPGTFFTEPSNEPHFAMTGDEDAILHLIAIGPSGTTYVDPADGTH